MSERKEAARKAIDRFIVLNGGSAGDAVEKHDKPDECDGYWHWTASDGRDAVIGWIDSPRPPIEGVWVG